MKILTHNLLPYSLPTVITSMSYKTIATPWMLLETSCIPEATVLSNLPLSCTVHVPVFSNLEILRMKYYHPVLEIN